MSMRLGLAVLAAGLVLTGCASSRGGQDVACPAFGNYALTPSASAFVADIQRYAVKDRGASASQASPGVGLETLGAPQASAPSVSELVQDTAFPGGMDLGAMRREGERLQR